MRVTPAELQNHLVRLQQALELNGLTFGRKKTEYVTFQWRVGGRDARQVVEVHLSDQSVKKIKGFKCL